MIGLRERSLEPPPSFAGPIEAFKQTACGSQHEPDPGEPRSRGWQRSANDERLASLLLPALRCAAWPTAHARSQRCAPTYASQRRPSTPTVTAPTSDRLSKLRERCFLAVPSSRSPWYSNATESPPRAGSSATAPPAVPLACPRRSSTSSSNRCAETSCKRQPTPSYSSAPRRFISVDGRAPLEEFATIAPSIPVFRVTSKN
jgi:hypothetical protein